MLHPERRAYFELAEKLGMPVSELLDRVSSAELTEWFGLWKVRNVEAKQQEARNKGKGRRSR